MNFILFDDHRNGLLPLTFTRPVAGIRIGILTIREKWEKYLLKKTSCYTEDYLSAKFPAEFTIDEDNVWINGSVCPNEKLVQEVLQLKRGHQLVAGDVLIAHNTGDGKVFPDKTSKSIEKFESHAHGVQVKNLWDIFSRNGEELQRDFDLLTKGR